MKHLHVFNHEHYHHALEHQIGNGIPVFSGTRQKGGGLGSIIGFLGRYALPLLKKFVFPHAKAAALSTLSDISSGKSIKEAVSGNAATMVKNVGHSIIKGEQTGSGLRTVKRKSNITLDSCHLLKRKGSTTKPKPKKKKKEKPKIVNKNRKKVKSKRDIFG